MKPFEASIKSAAVAGGASCSTPDVCASLLLETFPRVMRVVRMAMADVDAPALTIPQFRAIQFIGMHAGASLSVTAEFLGLTLPSTSKLVDQLVRRGVLLRDDDKADRRRMVLRLTHKGDALLRAVEDLVRAKLAEMLSEFGRSELAALQTALMLLQEHFPPLAIPGEQHPGGNGNLKHSGPTAVKTRA